MKVDPSSVASPFEQIRDQICSQILSGQLEEGTRLPAVRRLAADLGVAAGTVARAYRELEQSGLVTTNRRTGTVVAPRPARGTASPGVARLTQDYVAAMRRLGASDPAIVSAVREELEGPA